MIKGCWYCTQDTIQFHSSLFMVVKFFYNCECVFVKHSASAWQSNNVDPILSEGLYDTALCKRVHIKQAPSLLDGAHQGLSRLVL